MKKILSVILMIFLIFIGLCSTGVFKIKASNVVLKGQIFNLSNENTNMENIKINLFRKKTYDTEEYNLGFGLDKIEINVNSLGEYVFTEEIDYNYELSLNLSTLPKRFGILYENKVLDNCFYINKIEYCESFYRDNNINIIFFDINYNQLLVEYEIELLSEYVIDGCLYSDLVIDANGQTFYKSIKKEMINEQKLQNEYDIYQFNYSEKVIDTNSIDCILIYNNNLNFFNNSFVININMYNNSDSLIQENVIYFYLSVLNNVISMYDGLDFFKIIKENYNNLECNTIILTINFYLNENTINKESSNYSNSTINYNLNSNIYDIQNQTVIAHEFTHFIEDILSSFSVESGTPFDEGFATFMEYYYIKYYTNILYNDGFDVSSQNNEIKRLKEFITEYRVIFSSILEKNTNMILQKISTDNAPYILVSSNSNSMYNPYQAFTIFLSIFESIENDTIFFQTLFNFLINYEYYFNQAKFTNEEGIIKTPLLVQDYMFKILINLMGINVSVIIDDLFDKYYLNSSENNLFQNSNVFFYIDEGMGYSIILNPGESLYFPLSIRRLNYFFAEFNQEVNISIYNDYELVSSQNAQYMEYLNFVLNHNFCFIKIQNNKDSVCEFNYVYSDINYLDDTNGEILVELNNISYSSKYLVSNDQTCMFEFELGIDDNFGDYNLETILSIKCLSDENILNPVNIEIKEDNSKIMFYVLQSKEKYLINLNLFSLLNDSNYEVNNVTLIYNNTPDYDETITGNYLITEISHANLNSFLLLNYLTFGRYSIIFDVLDKSAIIQQFNISLVVSSANGNVTVYNNNIPSSSSSCITYIDIYKGDNVFIIYPSNSFNSDILIETSLFYDNSNTVYLIPDKEGSNSSLIGTEVRLNQGSYESNTITIGFSRCMFIEPNPFSVIRQNYYWFSNNDAVAEVSEFGTVLAENTGYATIYCIYKFDFTIIGTYTIHVVNDENINIKYLDYGLDVRITGDVSGTEVDLNGGLKYTIGNHTDPITIGIGYTRYICLGEDSPTLILQHFDWESNSQSVYVSQFGTIVGMEKSDNYCIITGTYKFNTRFKVVIKVIVQ